MDTLQGVAIGLADAPDYQQNARVARAGHPFDIRRQREILNAVAPALAFGGEQRHGYMNIISISKAMNSSAME